MRVVVVGAHGKIGRLTGLLLVASGHTVVGVVRNPDQLETLQADGVEPYLLDLEHSDADAVDAALAGADAVVFAAGAGPGSGAARKLTMDRDGAVAVSAAAERTGVRRVLLVSSMGADDGDPDSDDVFAVYQAAKGAADADLRARDLDWTIVRPGGLTDEPAAGRVALAPSTGPGQVSRADVAGVLVALLQTGSGVGAQVELVAGDMPVAEAVAAL